MKWHELRSIQEDADADISPEHSLKSLGELWPYRHNCWFDDFAVDTGLRDAIGAQLACCPVPAQAPPSLLRQLFAVADQRGVVRLGLISPTKNVDTTEHTWRPELSDQSLWLAGFEAAPAGARVLALQLEPFDKRQPRVFKLWIHAHLQARQDDQQRDNPGDNKTDAAHSAASTGGYRRYHALVITSGTGAVITVQSIDGLQQKNCCERLILHGAPLDDDTPLRTLERTARHFKVANPERAPRNDAEATRTERPSDLHWQLHNGHWVRSRGRLISCNDTDLQPLSTLPLCLARTSSQIFAGCADSHLRWTDVASPRWHEQALASMPVALTPLALDVSAEPARPTSLLVLMQNGSLSVLRWRRQSAIDTWDNLAAKAATQDSVLDLSSTSKLAAAQLLIDRLQQDGAAELGLEQQITPALTALQALERSGCNRLISRLLNVLIDELNHSQHHTVPAALLQLLITLENLKLLDRTQRHGLWSLLQRPGKARFPELQLNSAQRAAIEALNNNPPMVTLNSELETLSPQDACSIWANLFDVVKVWPAPASPPDYNNRHSSHQWPLLLVGGQHYAPRQRGDTIHFDSLADVVDQKKIGPSPDTLPGRCLAVLADGSGANAASTDSNTVLLAALDGTALKLCSLEPDGRSWRELYRLPTESEPQALRIVPHAGGIILCWLARGKARNSLHLLALDRRGTKLVQDSFALDRGDERLLAGQWRDGAFECAIASRTPGPVLLYRFAKGTDAAPHILELISLSSGCCSLCFSAGIPCVGEYNGLVHGLSSHSQSTLNTRWSYQLSQSVIRLLPLDDAEHGPCVLAQSAGHNTTLLHLDTGLRLWNRYWHQPLTALQSDGQSRLLIRYQDGHRQLLRRSNSAERHRALQHARDNFRPAMHAEMPSAAAFLGWLDGDEGARVGRKSGARMARWLVENWGPSELPRLKTLCKNWDQRAAVIFINLLLIRFSGQEIPAAAQLPPMLLIQEPRISHYPENNKGDYYLRCLGVMRLRAARAINGRSGLFAQLHRDRKHKSYSWLQLEARRLLAPEKADNNKLLAWSGLDNIDGLPPWYFDYAPPAYRRGGTVDQLAAALVALLERSAGLVAPAHVPRGGDALITLAREFSSAAGVSGTLGRIARWMVLWRAVDRDPRHWRRERQQLLEPLQQLIKHCQEQPPEHGKNASDSARLHHWLLRLLAEAIPPQSFDLQGRTQLANDQLLKLRALSAEDAAALTGTPFAQLALTLWQQIRDYQDCEIEALVRGARLSVAPIGFAAAADGGTRLSIELQLDARQSVHDIWLRLSLFDAEQRRPLDSHELHFQRLDPAQSLPQIVLMADARCSQAVLCIKIERQHAFNSALANAQPDTLWYEEIDLQISTHARIDSEGLLRRFQLRTDTALTGLDGAHSALLLLEWPPTLPVSAIAPSFRELEVANIDLDALWHSCPPHERPPRPEQLLATIQSERSAHSELLLLAPANRLFGDWRHRAAADGSSRCSEFVDALTEWSLQSGLPVLLCLGPTAFRTALRERPDTPWHSWYRLPDSAPLRRETTAAIELSLKEAAAKGLNAAAIADTLDHQPEPVLHYFQELLSAPERAAGALRRTLESPKHRDWVRDELLALRVPQAAAALALASASTALPLARLEPGMRPMQALQSLPGRSHNQPKELLPADAAIDAQQLERARGARGASDKLIVHGAAFGKQNREAEPDALERVLGQYDNCSIAALQRSLLKHGLARLQGGVIRLCRPLQIQLLSDATADGNRLQQLRLLLKQHFDAAALLGLSSGTVEATAIEQLPLVALFPQLRSAEKKRLQQLLLAQYAAPSIASAALREVFSHYGPLEHLQEDAIPPLQQAQCYLLACYADMDDADSTARPPGADTETLLDPLQIADDGDGNDTILQLLLIHFAQPPSEPHRTLEHLRALQRRHDPALRLPVVLAGPGARALDRAGHHDFVRLDPVRLFERLEGATELRLALRHSITDQLPLSALSPFQFTGHLSQRSPLFVGRQDELAYLLHNVDQQHLLIVGPRRIGKTSLLLRFGRELAERGDARYLFCDLQRTQGADALARQLAAVAALHYKEAGTLQGDDLATVIGALDRRARHDKVLLVLLLNEVDELMADTKLANTLRSLSTEATQLRLVMTGYGTVTLLRRESHALYNFVQGRDFDGRALLPRAINLGDAEALLELLEKPPLNLRWDDAIDRSAAHQRLFDATEGIPWALQSVAHQLLRAVENKRQHVIQQAELDGACDEIRAELWRYMESFILRHGEQGDAPGLVGALQRQLLRAVLVALTRERYLIGQPAPIARAGLSAEALFATPVYDANAGRDVYRWSSFSPAECWHALERFAEESLNADEIERLHRLWLSFDSHDAFDFACLGLLLEPDPHGAGRYGFPRHLYPRLLVRQLPAHDKQAQDYLLERLSELDEWAQRATHPSLDTGQP